MIFHSFQLFACYWDSVALSKLLVGRIGFTYSVFYFVLFVFLVSNEVFILGLAVCVFMF